MSKIGKINISIPEKVKVALAGNILNIEGPLGKKSLDIDLETFTLDIKDGKEISIKPKVVDQNTKRLWGMNRSLINNAVIGIASKDKSDVVVSNIELTDCKIGFSVFRKKPEFGPASIMIENYKVTNIDTLQNVETGSSISFKTKQ